MKLTALYQFKLSKAWLTPMFLLKPIGKAGNNKIFNELFTNTDLIKVKDPGPIQDIVGNLRQRELKFITREGKKRSIVFKMVDDYKENHGVVKVKDYGRDCYLFRVTDIDTFEVYVAENYGHAESIFFMALCDGYLDPQIELLRKKINDA